MQRNRLIALVKTIENNSLGPQEVFKGDCMRPLNKMNTNIIQVSLI